MDAATAAFVLVFAAASLTNALGEIAASYEKATGVRIVANLGGSSTLARQIKEGAPADLFLSADEAQMDGLEKAGRIAAGTRRSVLSNTLVVVVPTESRTKISFEGDLARSDVARIAIAEPRSVPVGVYSKKFFESVGLWKALEAKVVPTENVRATLAAVESGDVDAGVVFRTDALISKRARIAFEVPAARGPKISYPFAVASDAPHAAEARRFLAYLTSARAREVFRRYGFGEAE